MQSKLIYKYGMPSGVLK